MTIARFRIRRDTAANWNSINPTLQLGEPGLETDTRRVKYGDGATAWNGLAYSRALALWGDVSEIPTTIMAAQPTNNVAITGGSIDNLRLLNFVNSAAGGSVGGLNITIADTVAGVSHLSRFYTQQQGGGIGRTLFYAASPTTGSTRGQFDILTENGASFLMRLGFQVTGSNNTLDLHDIAGAVKVRLHSGGASFFVGSLGVGSTSPQVGGGVGVVAIANASTPPASNPVGGGVLYVEGGALKFRGSSGTVTTIAPA